MFQWIFWAISLFYSGLMIYFYVGIRRISRQRKLPGNWQPDVSVLVAARNEAGRITSVLESLSRQTYPVSALEIIIIDDHSCDGTDRVVSKFIEKQQLPHFRLLRYQTNNQKQSYKKNALQYAMQFTKGEVILSTDADCQVQPNWIQSMVAQYEPDTGLVAGLVTFSLASEKKIFHKLQTLEFAGLVFTGVGAVGNNYPLICNASNLSYRKQAFEEVGGFDKHAHIPSGDDDLLMQTLHHHTNWKIKYNLDYNAINFTEPLDSITAFINQRSRWASKSSYYPAIKTSLLLLMIYLFYFFVLILIPLVIFQQISAMVLLLGLILKIVPEFFVIQQALKILRRGELIRFFFIAQIGQIPYIVIAGLKGFFNSFAWKKESND